ncbi:MAG: 5-(carboxyamino)imidazole ribonucleotide mutase [Chloroflexi bacterium]|nr:5-(carboxyamino)imidazole ribonucleotide mutase [Chloroflexota bacterium]
MPQVGVVMGSRSDMPDMQAAIDVLAQLGIDYEVVVMSAHRAPERVCEYGKTARDRGLEVIIAGAGGAAHLPGVMAAWTTLPVIGVPLPSSDLKGMDALLSMAQMPAGVPVAVMGIGTSGARNAAYLAAQILGLKYENIRVALDHYRKELSEG